MTRVLVTYSTFAGSTADVARAVAAALAGHGCQAEVAPLDQVGSLEAYDGVIVGGPMILGWHRAARRFLRRHRAALRQRPLAVFVTAMSLTQPSQANVDGVPVYVDARLPRPPEHPGRLSLKERYAQLSSYVRPILAAARPARPVSVGVFGGRLDYGRLKWWAVLFAMVLVQAPAGDRRDWDAIRAWAESVAPAFTSAAQPDQPPGVEAAAALRASPG